MLRGYVPLLAIVAAIWGASYLFIKVAVDEVEPTAMMLFRLVLASLVLVPLIAWRLGPREAVEQVRRTGRGAFGVGLLNAAVPFTLIAWGEKHIDSGIAAIANASVPIFVVLLALRFNPSERVRGIRLAGILVGLLGVGVLTGLHPEGGWLAVAGTLAVVVASLSYAGANHLVQHRYAGTPALVTTTASSLTGAVILLPFALFQLPGEVPSWEAIGSIVALGVLATAVALLFYFRMLGLYGASRSSLVTYLLPPTALVYGVLILDERVTLNAALGLVLILAGVALGSGAGGGLLGRRRREAVPATPRS
ncbi:MAG TPA: DMT family transporter [Gaiellaceae bacterium]|nr:DMT family transporter [Gaiellaceae bacterium]